MIAVWWTFLVDHSLEFSVAFLLVYGIWRRLEKSVSAQWGYILFLVLGLKLILPGVFSLPLLPSYPPSVKTESTTVDTDIPDRSGVEKSKHADKPRRNSTVEIGLDAAPPEIAGKPIPIQSYIFWSWLGAVLMLTAREIRIHYRIRSLLRRSETLRSESLDLDLEALTRQAFIEPPLQWKVADWARAPMTFGFWQPVIIVPPALETKIPKAQLRWILMHELAHIRRGDYIVYLIQRMVGILYFFHPLVWWYLAKVNTLREFACDEEAARKSASSIRDCCEGLLSIAALRNGFFSQLTSASAVIHSESHLRSRIMKILNIKNNKKTPKAGLPVLLSCLFGLLVFSFSNVVPFASPQSDGGAVAPNPASAVPATAVNSSPALELLKKQMKPKESIFQTIEVPVGSYQKFALEASEGEIQLEAAPSESGSQITLLLTLEIKGKKGVLISDEVKKALANAIKITGDDKDPTQFQRSIKIEGALPADVNFDLIIRGLIPTRLLINANSGDGDLRIKGFESAVTGKTGDGDLAVENCRGNTTVITGDGDATVSNCNGPIEVKTGDGDISIENVSGSVMAKTGDGDIAVEKVTGPLTTETGDGDVAIENAKDRVDIKTGDGKVAVSDAVGPVSAHSGDGDLILEKIADCRKLISGSGNIELGLTKAPSQDLVCESSDGDIHLTLPPDAAVTLNLQVTGDGEIHTKNLNHFQETAKTEKSLEGKLNGGGVTIKLKVGDGSITIKN